MIQGTEVPRFFCGACGAAESRALIQGLWVEDRAIPGLKVETWGTPFRGGLSEVG